VAADLKAVCGRRTDQRHLLHRLGYSEPGPALKPVDIVIADNLRSLKGKPVRDAIRSLGTRLFFLPPDSPDLNLIEMMFAKLNLTVS
jgi:transposase